ncbi:MAG TPA: SIS domain-containing protein [Acidimicrobiales bacterium]
MTTIFEEEIRSQGDVLRRRTARGEQQAADAAASWRDVSYALVAARGSSDNAAAFFQYLAGRELELVVALATPSLFQDEGAMRLNDAGVLAISQSGRSPGMLDVVRLAKRQSRPNAVITNDVGSPLAEEADAVIELFAGAERAIASTKTFTTSCHALAQFVSAMAGRALPGLDDLPDVLDRTSSWALDASMPVSILNAEHGLTVVGRGVGYATASEISLKIREVTGLRSEAYSAPDFLHGPIGADGDGATLLLCVTNEINDDVAASLLHQCAQRGMRTVVLRSSERVAQSSDAEIVLPESMEHWTLGLAHVVVGQVLALRLGELRGRPIDTSPGLNKVTLTA